jgi:predicted nucleic acid-binding Zn ribbon protein
MQSFQSLLKKFTKNFKIEDGVIITALRDKWTDLVGETVAVHTFPDMIKDRQLTLIVDSPQWRHHLDFLKKDICEKIERYGIDDLKFRIGKIPESKGKLSKAVEAQLTEDDIRYIENTIKNVKDDELKETFRKLIAHGLTRKKK